MAKHRNMIDCALGRTLSVVMTVLIGVPLPALLIAVPLPVLAAANPGAKCGAARLKTVGKSCTKELACHAKYAKNPAKDPSQTKLAVCLAKNDDKLAKSLDKIRAKAKKQGAVCAIRQGEVTAPVGALASGILAGMLTDWDPAAGDVVDDRLRAALLKAGGKICGQVMAAVAKETIKPSGDGLDRRLVKSLIGFVKSSAKATAKAEKKGGAGIDVDVIQAVVDDVRETAESFVPQDDPDREVFEVSSGDNHSCLMRTDGSVECWGDDFYGQASAPDEDFIAVSSGGTHSCGIRESDDRAECWGDDNFGQTDAPIDEFGFVISAGGTHTCALRLDRTVVCWGDNSFGQLFPPILATQYSDVSAGLFHTCGLRVADQKVECWGDNFWGQSSAPNARFRQVSAGAQPTCGIETDSSLTCWGNTPFPPAGIYFDVSSGQNHSCALSSNDSTARCWGEFGPWRAPPDNETFFQISSGGRHTCAVRDPDATVMCWGNDDRGQTSCAGVEGCEGAAPAPCRIANVGPIIGTAKRFTVTRLLNDPVNDYRLVMPKAYLAELRVVGADHASIAELVDAFDERGFSCDGDDRIALEFTGDAISVVSLLDQLNVLGPLIEAVITEVVVPVKKWIYAKIGKFLIKTALRCLLRMLIFRQASQCV